MSGRSLPRPEEEPNNFSAPFTPIKYRSLDIGCLFSGTEGAESRRHYVFGVRCTPLTRELTTELYSTLLDSHSQYVTYSFYAILVSRTPSNGPYRCLSFRHSSSTFVTTLEHHRQRHRQRGELITKETVPDVDGTCKGIGARPYRRPYIIHEWCTNNLLTYLQPPLMYVDSI